MKLTKKGLETRKKKLLKKFKPEFKIKTYRDDET